MQGCNAKELQGRLEISASKIGQADMKREKYGGREKGVPNKATRDARRAIADFVDGNAHRLTEWLDTVAAGVQEVRVNPKTGEEEEGWLIKPDPARAFEMFQSVIEYHIPKLARTELVGDKEAPIAIETTLKTVEELLEAARLKRLADD